MKQRLGIAFLALLLCGAVGLAKTNYFDNIYVDGTATIVGATTFSGVLSIDDTTAASSTVTGSLHTDGGVGIAKNLYIGTDISMVGTTGTHDLFLTDSVADAWSIQRGTTDMVVFDTSTPRITFTPATTFTGDIVSDGTTDSSSTTTGAFQTDGGVGIAKTLYVGTGADITGNLAQDGATAVIDGSTSVRGLSAGFVSLESPSIRFGYSDSIYTSFAVADTTGNLTISHVGGSTDAVAWTAAGGLTFTGPFEVVGATTLDGVTISGDVDSAGLCDFQFNPVTGASNGHILKSTFTTATVYSGTSAGLIVKSYFADTGTTITGGEFTGVYINVKQLAAMAGGAKSSIISGHNYGSGGDYQSLDYGSILYGDLTWGYVLSGGTSTYGLYFGDQTISTADIYLQNGATIGEAVDGVLQIDSTTAIEVDGNLYVEDATNSGAMFVSQFSITYAQTASYTTCVIPANADVLKVEVVTTTAFSGGSATTIDVGYVGTLEAYASDLDIRSAGFADCDVFSNLGDVGVSDVTMKAQITTDESAGACTVYFYWTMGTPGTP